MIEKNPRDGHRILSERVWGYRTSKRSSIWVSHFSLTYGQDAVLPMEVVVPSLRVSRKNGLIPQQYSEAMMKELEFVDDRRIQAFNHMLVLEKKNNSDLQQANQEKSFEVGDLVWKIILPIGSKDKEFGKLSPNQGQKFRKFRSIFRRNFVFRCLQKRN